MKICTVLSVFVLFAVIEFDEAAFGIDISASATVAQLQQFKKNYTFFISRIYRSTGVADPVGVENILKARQAGFIDVDAYIFPCTNSCQKSAAAQVTEAIDGLEAQGAQVRTIWLNVEVPSLWSSDIDVNKKFISGMILTAGDRGYQIGIYTSKKYWEEIAGNSEEFSKYMLWWTNFTGVLDLTTKWENFGGWTSPIIHQYVYARTAYRLEYYQNVK